MLNYIMLLCLFMSNLITTKCLKLTQAISIYPNKIVVY